jgi:hypothetical protein
MITMDQNSVDELYAVARVTDSLLTGKAKKADFPHLVWFYEQVTDILARALLDNERCTIAEPQIQQNRALTAEAQL